MMKILWKILAGCLFLASTSCALVQALEENPNTTRLITSQTVMRLIEKKDGQVAAANEWLVFVRNARGVLEGAGGKAFDDVVNLILSKATGMKKSDVALLSEIFVALKKDKAFVGTELVDTEKLKPFLEIMDTIERSAKLYL